MDEKKCAVCKCVVGRASSIVGDRIARTWCLTLWADTLSTTRRRPRASHDATTHRASFVRAPLETGFSSKWASLPKCCVGCPFACLVLWSGSSGSADPTPSQGFLVPAQLRDWHEQTRADLESKKGAKAWFQKWLSEAKDIDDANSVALKQHVGTIVAALSVSGVSGSAQADTTPSKSGSRGWRLRR